MLGSFAGQKEFAQTGLDQSAFCERSREPLHFFDLDQALAYLEKMSAQDLSDVLQGAVFLQAFREVLIRWETNQMSDIAQRVWAKEKSLHSYTAERPALIERCLWTAYQALKRYPESRPAREALSGVLAYYLQVTQAAHDFLQTHRADWPFSSDEWQRLRHFAQLTLQLEADRAQEQTIKGQGFELLMLKGADSYISPDFLSNPFVQGLLHGKILKQVDVNQSVDAQGVNEMVWRLPGTQGDIVLKQVQPYKMPFLQHEMRTMQRAWLAGLPGVQPLGMLSFGAAWFIVMRHADGHSVADLTVAFDALGIHDEAAKRAFVAQIFEQMVALAQAYRSTLWLDKKWYRKDLLVRTSEVGRVAEIVPLDFERAEPCLDTSQPLNVNSKSNFYI